MKDVQIQDIREKGKRVYFLLEKMDLDAVIIGRRDNFSWFTCGGDSHVLSNTEQGASCLVITKNEKYLCAYPMNGRRVMDEEVKNQEFELKISNWYEESPVEMAEKMTKGRKVGSDLILNGAKFLTQEIVDLHYPLTELELERCRWLGERSDECFINVAKRIKQSQTEYEIGASILQEFYKNGITLDVLIIGSDERAFKYRHPMPTDKKFESYVLMHAAARKFGLHLNITRLVHIGEPPKEIMDKYEAACIIHASVVKYLTPGMLYVDVFDYIKKLYLDLGYPDEWKNHFQACLTGYIVGDPLIFLDKSAMVRQNQPFDCLITITGVKSEELSLIDGAKNEFYSLTGKWPKFTVRVDGQDVEMPQILVI